jgi:hypothetical protein
MIWDAVAVIAADGSSPKAGLAMTCQAASQSDVEILFRLEWNVPRL